MVPLVSCSWAVSSSSNQTLQELLLTTTEVTWMKKERSVRACFLWTSLKCDSKSGKTHARQHATRETVGGKQHTFNRDLWAIIPLPVTGDIISHFDTSVQLLREQIVLVQEQYDLSSGQDLIRRDLFPQLVGILEAVDAVVFEEFLVKDAERGEEDDSVHIVEERCPRSS